LALISEIKEGTAYIQNNMDKWKDKNVPLNMIRENNYRVHTLE